MTTIKDISTLQIKALIFSIILGFSLPRDILYQIGLHDRSSIQTDIDTQTFPRVKQFLRPRCPLPPQLPCHPNNNVKALKNGTFLTTKFYLANRRRESLHVAARGLPSCAQHICFGDYTHIHTHSITIILVIIIIIIII